MASPSSMDAHLDLLWALSSPLPAQENFETMLIALFENIDEEVIDPKKYDKLEVLLNKESTFFPDMTFPLMAIKAPLYLVNMAVKLQEEMIQRECSSLVSQERWNATLKFDWMCQAVMLNPSLEILQFLHSKECSLLDKFKDFLRNKPPAAESLIAMQEFEKTNLGEEGFIASFFTRTYSDDVVKFIFEKLL